MAEPEPKRQKVILKGKTVKSEPARQSADAEENGNGEARRRPREEARPQQQPPPEEPRRTIQKGSGAVKLAASADISCSVASFDVCGQIFKVPSKLILAKPDTLLAQLVTQIRNQDESSKKKPIHVDTHSDRFQIILDWYRHGEMFVPRHIPVGAVLRDCSRLMLPDEVVVNGVSRNTRNFDIGAKVARNLMACTITRWPGFAPFLEATLDAISSHFQSVGSKSGNRAEMEDAEEAYDFPPFLLALYGEKGWLDTKHICSPTRARVLALKLEESGYRCEFSDTDLVVSLPLELRGERYHPGGEDGGEGEEAFEEGEGGEGF